MHHTRSRFRNSVAVAGCVLAGALVGACGEGALPAAPSTVSRSAADAASAAQLSQYGEDIFPVGDELARVRRATAAFHDVNAAIAAGYQPEPICVQTPAGAGGVHAVNRTIIASQSLDPERPAALLYMPRPDGGLRLVGVEYVRFVLVRNLDTGDVGPWLPQSRWPSTYEVANTRPELFGQAFAGEMAGHGPAGTMPWHWDLHVWLWANNPSGIFETWNPAISCN